MPSLAKNTLRSTKSTNKLTQLRYRHQQWPAAGTVPARHPGLDEGLMMKKNQMPPNLLLGVVGLIARLPAARTVEPAAFGKINQNGQLALYRVKFNCRWSI